jgi:hypothetical protein
MPKMVDLTGQTFARLTVVRLSERRGGKRTMWACTCECGGTATVESQDLRSGNTKSCGCLRSETSRLCGQWTRKHGRTRTPEYRSWRLMKDRCYNPKKDNYERYGGRGIKVCERWRSDFPAFLADMGLKPAPEYTLDRWPDKDGDYTPANCRWAKPTQQQNNLRNNVMLTARGKTQTVSQWAREVGLEAGVLHYRVRKGWPAERALTEPVKK